MEYQAMRVKAGMSCEALATQLKADYPKMNKAVISYAENSALSGVQYTSAAKKRLQGIFGAAKAQDKRKDAHRVGCWLSDSLFELFNECRRLRGNPSMKEYLIYIITQDAEKLGIEKAATPSPKE